MAVTKQDLEARLGKDQLLEVKELPLIPKTNGEREFACKIWMSD